MSQPLQEFVTKEAASEYLARQYSGLVGLSPDVAGRILECLDVIQQEPKLPPGAAPALIKKLRWVIRNDDLQLLDAILKCVIAAAGAGLFLIPEVKDYTRWAALTQILVTVLQTCRQAVSKGVILEPRRFAVLLALREHGPLRSAQLVARLQSTGVPWTSREVKSHLETLKECAVRDGSMRALAVEERGRWRVAEV